MFFGKGGSSLFARFSWARETHSVRVRTLLSAWSQCPFFVHVSGVFSARANPLPSDCVYRSVRRLSVLLLLAALPVSLFGCGASPKLEIGWQEYPFTIKAEAECRERFGDSGADIRITATAPGEGELEFLAPDTLKGLCISVHDGAGEVRLGELCSPLRGSVLEDVRALFSLTALDASRMTDIYLEDGEGSVNVARITLCLPASDGAAAETGGAGSAKNADSAGGHADGAANGSRGGGSGADNGVNDGLNGGNVSTSDGGVDKKADNTVGDGNNSGTDDGVETMGMLTVRIDSKTGNPLEMQADFITGEALRLRIYEYSSDGAADGMTD